MCEFITSLSVGITIAFATAFLAGRYLPNR